MEGLRDLRFNYLRDSESGLKVIAMLSKLDSLSVVWSNGINDAILDAWAAMTNLKSLSLENSPVEPASVLKLQQALPGCTIKVNPDIQQAIDNLRAKR
jgi:hypothetical protein